MADDELEEDYDHRMGDVDLDWLEFGGKEKAWDESAHPREPAGSPEGGQFAGGAGGGGGGEGSQEWEAARAKGDATSAEALTKRETKDTATIVKEIVEKFPGAQQRIDEIRGLLDKSIPTDRPRLEGGFKDGKTWAPNRAALHDRLIAKYLSLERVKAATPAAGQTPTLHLLGGRGGAGKSWFTKEDGTGGKVDLAKSFLINNDEIKKDLPEWQGWNARDLHEEASEIGDRLEALAREMKLNIVIDGTMRSPGNLQRRVDTYKKEGFRVEGHYMYASPRVAAERALKRFMDGGDKGRYVPLEYSVSSTTNEGAFDSVRGQMDYWEIYDNNESDFNPQLHAEGGTDFFEQSAREVVDYAPGVKAANNNDNVKAAKETWFAKSRIKDIRQIVREAPATQAFLDRAASRVAAVVGVPWKNPGAKTKSAKGIARTRAKIAARKGDASRVTDVARGTFIVNSPAQVDQLTAELSKDFEVTVEDWKLTDVNYFDRTVNLRMPNGMVAEIQIIDPDMSLAKSSPDQGGGGGHDMYAQARVIDPYESEAAREKYDELMGGMSELYGGVTSNYSPQWRSEFERQAREYAVLSFKPPKRRS